MVNATLNLSSDLIMQQGYRQTFLSLFRYVFDPFKTEFLIFNLCWFLEKLKL